MIRSALAAAAVILPLSACQVDAEDPGSAASAAPFLGSTAAAAPPALAPNSISNPFAIRPERNRSDLVAGCQGMNPEQRPRGSNCFGIFPEQCGADRADDFRGQPLTAEVRQRIEAIEPPGGIRFIRPNEPVTDDLRFARLNVHVDAQDRIETVDCY